MTLYKWIFGRNNIMKSLLLTFIILVVILSTNRVQSVYVTSQPSIERRIIMRSNYLFTNNLTVNKNDVVIHYETAC